jgi:predicted nucleic acid-binding protein
MEAFAVSIDDALRSVTSLFLDTAPVIYYVEKNPIYLERVKEIFGRLDKGSLTAVTSPVTLSEALVHPMRQKLAAQQQDFVDLIVAGRSVRFVPIECAAAIRAAELRAKYNLSLTDALQISTALTGSCEAFLTNDFRLKKVSEIRIVVSMN